MSGSQNLAYSYPLLGAFWTLMWIFLWILWIMLLFRVIGDVFRDDRLSGWAKTGWTFFVIILPFLGVLVYLGVRGRGMGQREQRYAKTRQEDFNAYMRDANGPRSHADELAKLSQLKKNGEITDAEFRQAKERILAA